MSARIVTLGPKKIQVPVPDWANWVAQDSYGWWYCFREKPTPNVSCWLQPREDRSPHRIYPTGPDPVAQNADNWQETLQAI